MKREHKVTKDVFLPPRKFASIRVTASHKQNVRPADILPFSKRMGISPSQPHSKVYGR